MSEVTRSGAAESGVAASYAERQRRTQPNGWWGAALFVTTEAALFGSLIASYFYLRFQAVRWPPPGIEAPKVALPLVLTAVLVATSVPMFRAVRSAGMGAAKETRRWILVALAIQCAYLAVQVILFRDDLNSFSPSETSYGSIYFTLLAAHHAHVLLGLLLNGWLLARLASGLTNYRLIATRVIALYWYFVNALAVLVVLTQLYPSL